MSFDFSISSESAVRTAKRNLAPWNIYDVKFKGIETLEFEGKKDSTQHYKMLAINFENEDGVFSVRRFFPKEGDDVRREYDSKNGGKVVFPSNFEELMAIVKQTGQILNPSGFEKMQAASGKFKSFEDVVKALTQITNSAKDKETKIKLIGRNRDGKVYAEIPRIVGINKQGEAFISDNYLGDKLFFSDYEEGEREKYLKAKPTEMKTEDPIVDTAGVDKPADNDFDLESLL